MAATCPNCGGSDTRQIGSGYWECQEKDYVAEGRGRDVACRQRFHAGPPAPGAPLCSCGTFATGACVGCGDWVCGDHSVLWPGKGRLCLNEPELRRKREAEEQRQRLIAADDVRKQEEQTQHEEKRAQEQSRRNHAQRDQVVALILIGAGVLLFWQGARSGRFAVAGTFFALAFAHGTGQPINRKDEPFWTVFWAGALGAVGGYVVSVLL